MSWLGHGGLRESARSCKVFLELLGSTGPRYAARGAFRGLGPCETDERHLREAMLWLWRAEEVTGGKGVSKCYHFKQGWAPEPYPETTGYILETFLRYFKFTGATEYKDRAVRMGRWEIEIQHPSGGVIGQLESPDILRTFNTGQVLHGWCSLYRETGQEPFLRAAVRAGDYLLAVQEEDGSWQRDSYCGARTYDARIAWALLRLASLEGGERYARAAMKNLQWVLAQQQPNGWWQNCGFFDRDPITHLLAYTIRGLLESHLLLKDRPGLIPGLSPGTLSKLRDSALLAADALARQIEGDPALGIPGLPHHSYGSDWTSRDRSSCLTGNVQLAGIFYIASRHFDRKNLAALADTMVQTAKRMQDLSCPVNGIRGGFPGPFPIYQGYDPFSIPNWSTKFLADVLLFRLNGFSEC